MSTDYIHQAADKLRPVPDFPEEGILFWDLNPVLANTEVWQGVNRHLADVWRSSNIDIVAGFDSRGFLFGPMVAAELGVGFTMIRKKGKLPPPVVTKQYGLEYGTDAVELADDGSLTGKRVLLIDDLLATGGTAAAGIELVRKVGGIPVGLTCLTELPALNGREKCDIDFYAPIKIVGDKITVRSLDTVA